MIKLFYYDEDTENLFAEEDAELTTFEELVEELFHLNDDNISYVGFITKDDKYKIKSDQYDSYTLYQWDAKEEEYVLIDLGDFEKMKKIILSYFVNDDFYSSAILYKGDLKINKWMPPPVGMKAYHPGIAIKGSTKQL